MSREIKFRAWDRITKKMYNPGENTLCASNQWGKPMLIQELETTDPFSSKCVESRVYQQFTGLVDKNGVEIYEGDLVNFIVPGAAHGREVEEYKNQEVYYDEEFACFMFGKNYTKTGDYWGHSLLDEVDLATIEVVGNIFENNK